MGTPTANTSRETFDASKGYVGMRLQQGVPVFDADINDVGALSRWYVERITALMSGAVTLNQTVQSNLFATACLMIDPILQEANGNVLPSPFTALSGWYPGSMRPYVFDTGASNNFAIMNGPAFVAGLYLDDYESRGVAASYNNVSNYLAAGKVSALPGGTTIEDDSKDFTGTTGDLHLVAPSAGVGNGRDCPCRVRFTNGAEAGNEYPINAVPSSNQLTVTGPFTSGGPSVGDEYIILPNDLDFQDSVVDNVWLQVWVQDIDKEEDTDLEEPTTLIEASHRLKVNYCHRVFRDGGNLPTSAVAPQPADAAPQTREGRVYWVLLAQITPDASAPTIFPAAFAYSGLPSGVTEFSSHHALRRYIQNEIGSTTSDYIAADAVVTAASDAADQAIDDVLRDRLSAGWFSSPSALIVGTNLNITSTGTAFIDGEAVTTPTDTVALTGLTPSTFHYVYYEAGGTDAWQVTSTPANADGGDRVLYGVFNTDGLGDIDTGTFSKVDRNITRADGQWVLTLGSSSTKAAFQSLEAALGAAARLYNAGAQGIVIEVLDLVTVPNEIDNPNLLLTPSLTFRGRGAPVLGGSSGGFTWSFTGSLFDATDPSNPAISNWTFENIYFKVDGTSGSNLDGIIKTNTSSDLFGITFRRCNIDGNGLFSGFGGGSGVLANLIAFQASGTESLQDITIEDCEIRLGNAVLSSVFAGTGNATRIKIRNNHIDTRFTDIRVGGSGGGIFLGKFMTLRDSRITGNQIANVHGPLVQAGDVERVWITGNECEQRTDTQPMVDLGNPSVTGTGTQALDDVFIHDNHFHMNISGGFTGAVIDLESGSLATNLLSVFIHNNHIEGSNESDAGTIGIRLAAEGTASNQTMAGVVINHNVINNVDIDIKYENLVAKTVVAGNVMFGGTYNVETSAESDQHLLLGNICTTVVATTGVTNRGIVKLGGDSYALAGNLFEPDNTAEIIATMDPGNVGTRFAFAGNVFVNNPGTEQFNTDESALAGNVILGSNANYGGNNSALVGNYVAGIPVDGGTGNVVANNS